MSEPTPEQLLAARQSLAHVSHFDEVVLHVARLRDRLAQAEALLRDTRNAMFASTFARNRIQERIDAFLSGESA